MGFTVLSLSEALNASSIIILSLSGQQNASLHLPHVKMLFLVTYTHIEMQRTILTHKKIPAAFDRWASPLCVVLSLA